MRINLIRHLVATSSLVLFFSTSVWAFLIQTYDSSLGPVQQSWRRIESGIPFIIHDAGSDDLGKQETYRIIRESFAIWGQVSTSAVHFTDQGLTSTLVPSRGDRNNLIFFDERGTYLDAPPGSGVIAVTRINTNTITGQITDADIVFNGRGFRFDNGASQSSNNVDLKDVAVHEIGHLLGLDHSPLSASPRPTMNPFYSGNEPGQAQILEADDIAGISVLYPTPIFLVQAGTISGRVTSPAGAPLFGAHVIAENLENGDRYSTVSGAYSKNSDPGQYFLRGLSPGPYHVKIEPIQGAITEANFGGIFRGFATNFPVEYYGNTTQVGFAPTIALAAAQNVGTINFITGLRQPGLPFIEPLTQRTNTPNIVGPYVLRFQIDDAERVLLSFRAGMPAPVSTVVVDQVQTIAMTESAPGVYTAHIPGQTAGTQISYQVQAFNSTGDVTVYPQQDRWSNFEIIELSGSPLVFTAVREENVVSVFDADSQRQLARIPTGDQPIQVILSPDGERLFVSNLASRDITVIQTSTFEVLERIEVDAEPLDLALSPDGRFVYVANSGSGSLTTIDLETGAVDRIALNSVLDGPFGVVAVGSPPVIYYSDLGRHQVVGVRPDGSEIARLNLPNRPRSLAASPDGRWLYASSFGSGNLSIIDVAQNQIAATVELSVSGTFAVAVSPDGSKVYLTAHLDNALLVVDAAERALINIIETGSDPRALSFSPDGKRLFVTHASSDEIAVIATATDQILSTYRAGSGPRGIAVAPAPLPQHSTAVNELPARPSTFSLQPNFPNPFNAETQIVYTLPASISGDLKLELAIYNATGQKVRTLTRGAQDAGTYRIAWDGKDDRGTDLASGVYMLTLSTPSARALQKMLLLR